MRVYQHVIDTKAIKTTLNSIPHHWVVRELSERDYGVDLMIEIFRKGGTNSDGHDYYDATGEICYLQLKGVNSQFEYKGDSLSFQIEKDTLLYAEKFATPVILIRVCVVEGHEKVHFLWLQRYIMEVLDFEIPDWRERKIKSPKSGEEQLQQSYAIKIPRVNSLPEKAGKIEKIAARIKYVEEHTEFHERYTNIQMAFMSIIKGSLKPAGYALLRKELGRIKRFSTLFAHNNCCIDAGCIQDLIDFVNSTERGVAEPTSLEDFPHEFNFKLLYDENMYRISIEGLVAENNGETAY